MTDYPSAQGKTTIDPGVLITIARLTTLAVPGVSRMAKLPSAVDTLLKRNYEDGVKLVVEDEAVYLDLFVILKNDCDFRKTGKTIQQKVSRAVSEMVGMEIGHVNIHIEDIDYSSAVGS